MGILSVESQYPGTIHHLAADLHEDRVGRVGLAVRRSDADGAQSRLSARGAVAGEQVGGVHQEALGMLEGPALAVPHWCTVLAGLLDEGGEELGLELHHVKALLDGVLCQDHVVVDTR